MKVAPSTRMKKKSSDMGSVPDPKDLLNSRTPMNNKNNINNTNHRKI